MTGVESLLQKQFEKTNLPNTAYELPEIKELPDDIETGEKPLIEPPDISFIERTSRSALMEQCPLRATEQTKAESGKRSEITETKTEGLTEEEKAKIKEETGFTGAQIMDKIIEIFTFTGIKIPVDAWHSYDKINLAILKAMNSQEYTA